MTRTTEAKHWTGWAIVLRGDGGASVVNDADSVAWHRRQCDDVVLPIPDMLAHVARIAALEAALADCLSDLEWIEKQDPRSNFQASIIKARAVLSTEPEGGV